MQRLLPAPPRLAAALQPVIGFGVVGVGDVLGGGEGVGKLLGDAPSGLDAVVEIEDELARPTR